MIDDYEVIELPWWHLAAELLLLGLILVGIVYVCGVRWPKRFSIRDLLIVTTLVAVVLGMLLVVFNPTR